MADVTWKSAVTYPDAPHEYVLRERYPQTYAFYQERIAQAGLDEHSRCADALRRIAIGTRVTAINTGS
jgi:hypothetical protein